MYKIVYTENGITEQKICKVKDLGIVLKELREKGIMQYRILNAKDDDKQDVGEKSNIFV